MGNRAVIAVKGSSVGIYLHWNGGEGSVAAFLRAAKDLGVRDPMEDTSYFMARLVQIVGNFFGGTTSVGVEAMDRIDYGNGDNGTYWVGSGFAYGREFVPSGVEIGVYDKIYSGMVYGEVMAANPMFQRGYTSSAGLSSGG